MLARFKNVNTGEIIILNCDSVRNTQTYYACYGVDGFNGDKTLVCVKKTKWKRIQNKKEK